MNNTTFQVGTTYNTGSGDYVWTFTVIARTAKFLTITDGEKVSRVGVRSYSGHEFASPLGTYSMAPVICSERPA